MNQQQMQRATSDELAIWHDDEEQATKPALDTAIRTLRGLVHVEGADAFRTLPISSRYHDADILAAVRRLIENIDGYKSPRWAQPASTSRFGGPWSTDEESALVRSFRVGDDLHALMGQHQRSANGILFRLHPLGCMDSPDLPAFELARNEAAFLCAEQGYLDPTNAFERADPDGQSRFEPDVDDIEDSQDGFKDSSELVDELQPPDPCADWSCCFDDMYADQWEELMSAPAIEDMDTHYFNQGTGR